MFLDALAGLFGGVIFVPSIYEGQTNSDILISKVFGLGIGEVSFELAWLWSSIVAYHVLYVVSYNVRANSSSEKRVEAIYYRVLLGLGCVFVPLLLYFEFGETKYPPGGIVTLGLQHQVVMQSVFLFTQWVFVASVCVAVHVKAQTPAAKLYRRQTVVFLVTFVALTSQRLYFLIQIALAINSPNADISIDPYLQDIGQRFVTYKGMCNALLWGFTSVHTRTQCKRCMVLCINAVLPSRDNIDGHHRSGSNGDSNSNSMSMLELPLLEPALPKPLPIAAPVMAPPAVKTSGMWGDRAKGKQPPPVSDDGGNGSSGSSISSRNGDVWESIQTIDAVKHLQVLDKIGMGSFGQVFKGNYQVGLARVV
jgi:hypothetical protein